jgi:hypothetical protein
MRLFFALLALVAMIAPAQAQVTYHHICPAHTVSSPDGHCFGCPPSSYVANNQCIPCPDNGTWNGTTCQAAFPAMQCPKGEVHPPGHPYKCVPALHDMTPMDQNQPR